MSAKRLLLIPVLGYVAWLVLAYDYHFLDGVNLLFHEAGHVFLGSFGETLHFLGGTLGQLFFPIACGVHFLQRQQRYESWLMGVWLAESLMYSARYLGDARDQVLPLVGGHIHDWGFLLGRWGLIDHCEAIAAVLHGVASALAVACWVGAWRATGAESPVVVPGISSGPRPTSDQGPIAPAP
jgi:hypothetical protein